MVVKSQKAEQAKKLYESGFSAHMKAMRQGLRVKKGTIYNKDAHGKKYGKGKSKSPPAVPLGSDFRRGRRRVVSPHASAPGSPWGGPPDPVLCLGPSMSPPTTASKGGSMSKNETQQRGRGRRAHQVL